MVKCKRMLASLLSIMMVFSLMTVPTYAASTYDSDDYIYAEKLYNDVSADDSFYTALAILSRLDIIVGDDKGNFNPDNTITRAEAAAVVVRLTGMSDTYTGSQNTKFVDVPNSHWASGVIATANSMGIVEGYGNGYF